MTDADRRQPDPAPLAPDERIRDTFPLSRWAELADFYLRIDALYERAADLARQTGTSLPDDAVGGGWGGVPLPKGTDWAAYSVELIESTAHPEDFPFGGWTLEGGERRVEYNPDGSLRELHASGRVAWQHVRTVIRHTDAVAVLQWEWVRGTGIGRISIVGLETDPDPDLSCRVLTRAIPLLRDNEWRGQRPAGRPTLTDEDVRRDLAAALERCREKHWQQPTLRQLADWHPRPFDPASDQFGVTESALRERMRKHPGPFRDLVPWIRQRTKK
ncbi:MAG: hypothetical protein ACLQBX_11455 [Candidatus Limnocylindrales bacterium]